MALASDRAILYACSKYDPTDLKCSLDDLITMALLADMIHMDNGRLREMIWLVMIPTKISRQGPPMPCSGGILSLWWRKIPG